MIVSDNTVWSKEANNEINQYLNSIASVISPSGKLTAGATTSLIKRTIYNISK
jgi:hypothetical protein